MPTAGQVDALASFVECGSQAAAARHLGISERAVKLRIRRLRDLLRVQTTEQAIYVGRARGWLVVQDLDSMRT